MNRYLVLVPGVASGLIQWADSRAAAAAGACYALGLAALPTGAIAIAIAGAIAPAVFHGYDVDGMAIYSGVFL